MPATALEAMVEVESVAIVPSLQNTPT
jgi:hypothetical protein